MTPRMPSQESDRSCGGARRRGAPKPRVRSEAMFSVQFSLLGGCSAGAGCCEPPHYIGGGVLRRPSTCAQGEADAVRLMRAFNMSPLLWQEAGALGMEATVRLRPTHVVVCGGQWCSASCVSSQMRGALTRRGQSLPVIS